MTAPVTPTPNPPARDGHDGFAQLLRTEWIKFWTVRGSMTGMALAGLLTVLLGLLYAAVVHPSCSGPNGDVCPSVPAGPNGEAVSDKFYFVHQPMVGDGSITVRVTSLSGLITYPPPRHNAIVAGVVPWAKAGVVIARSTRQGSAYAAMMVTGGHGVRMQDNFVQDIAGHPGGVSPASPRWLRLTRSGNVLTGYESTDGTRWTTVGAAHLSGMGSTVQVGLFVASPCDLTVSEAACRLTQATAVFDRVSLRGRAPRGAWSGDRIGIPSHAPALALGGFRKSADGFTVTGSGDIAPLGSDPGWTIRQALTGALVGLIAVVIVMVRYVTARDGRGLIGTALSVSPRPGRVLAAKAVVAGGAAFAVGLAAALVAVLLCEQVLSFYGDSMTPVTPATELRVIVGTAAVFAVSAVLALALGSLFRRSAVAVVAAVGMVILPDVLAIISVLPAGASQWLLRVTPAAAFAIQQPFPEYAQVTGLYTPVMGYYPLPPWGGFAVLCGYAALVLALAVLIPRRRDA